MLLLALALAATNGLKVFVTTTTSRPASAVRCYTARMALPKIEDARSLSTEEIEAEISTAKKVRTRTMPRAPRRRPGERAQAACTPPLRRR